MSKVRRPMQGKKLLVAKIGVAALTFAGCAVFPGCNLMAPPSCAEDPYQYECQDMNATPKDLSAKPEDLSRPADLVVGGDAGDRD